MPIPAADGRGRAPSAYACGNSVEAKWLRDEQAAGEHPLRLRLRRVELERELRQALAEALLHQRTAIDVATRLVTEAAGGRNAATSFPFAMRHLAEFKRYRTVPTGATTTTRLAHLDEAWRAIDGAVAAEAEIRSADPHDHDPALTVRSPSERSIRSPRVDKKSQY